MLSPATDTKAAPGCWYHRTKGAQALSFDVGGEAGEIEADDDDEVGEDEDGAFEVVALERKLGQHAILAQQEHQVSKHMCGHVIQDVRD